MRSAKSDDATSAGPEDLVPRTKRFALRILEVAASLPRTDEARMIADQIRRAGTSVGSNYRAARRGRSRAEMKAKLGIVEEEADEVCFWLEIIGERKLLPSTRLADILDEANQIVAMIVSARKRLN